MTIHDLGNRKILNDGTVICNQSALLDMLYSGMLIDNIICDSAKDESEWQEANKICDTTFPGPIFSENSIYKNVNWFDYWVTPIEYKNIDIDEWCHARCNSKLEHDRVSSELSKFKERNMYPIIKHLLYCVDVWRKNNIVWGVGRGSSVCSFVLHLTGINRINPLDYDLSIDEWLT